MHARQAQQAQLGAGAINCLQTVWSCANLNRHVSVCLVETCSCLLNGMLQTCAHFTLFQHSVLLGSAVLH